MRSLNRNKQKFYYALYLGETEYVVDNEYTGEVTLSYSDPVAFYANISAARGETEMTPFGTELKYSKVIVTNDTTCPINEHSRVWIDADPDSEPYDYTVVKVAKSLNSISYAVKEVATDDYTRYD